MRRRRDEQRVLDEITRHLLERERCHTVLLYGSRARGEATATSDFDVLGLRRGGGARKRISKHSGGAFWDVFVYPEKALARVSEEQWLSWRDAKVLHETARAGQKLLARIRSAGAPKLFKPLPDDELEAMRVWFGKQLERIAAGGAQGDYRRAELLAGLVGDYFAMRRLRYFGPKAGLAWLEAHDASAHRLIARALRAPASGPALKAAGRRVYLFNE